MENRALLKAVSVVGSQTGLARKCGVIQQHVWNWINRDNRVPAEFALKVAEATDFEVRPHDLRPDLYPNTDDCVPDKNRGAAA